jgi:hypothetical protein
MGSSHTAKLKEMEGLLFLKTENESSGISLLDGHLYLKGKFVNCSVEREAIHMAKVFCRFGVA